MSNAVVGILIILFLIILNCGRLFFLKFGRVDVLTLLAPLCVILSILQIIAWKADFFSLILLGISVFCFFVNFRAFLRFLSGLYVDHYSFAFKIGAIVVLLAAIAEVVLIAMFFPRAIKDTDFNTKKTVKLLSGSFNYGFEKVGLLPVINCEMFIFEPTEESLKKDTVVLFFPDKRADTSHYEPYLMSLANNGYAVCSADYFSKDLKWFHSFADNRFFRRMFMIIKYFSNETMFATENEFYTYNTIKECEETLKFAKQYFGEDKKFFFIGDVMTFEGTKDFASRNLSSSEGYFNIAELEDYKTPGFGCIQQLAPVLGYKFNLEPLSDFSIPRKMAEDTIKMIPENSKPKAELIEENSSAEEKSENTSEINQ
jgi:hypothetical protein